jgi:nitronate monooxygenase
MQGEFTMKNDNGSKKPGSRRFQVGSILLASQESALQDFEKQRLEKVREEDVVLTKSFQGRYARGIKNKFIETLENSDYILPYPYQNKLTGALRKAARNKKNADFVNLWLGQSINQYSKSSTEEILKNLIRSCE